MFKKKLSKVGLILTVLVFISFFAPFANQDIHSVRLDAINSCFEDGQIPCRWVVSLENFYGSPIFNYYPPLPYYIGSLIFGVTKDLATSVKIIFSISLIGAFFFMFLLRGYIFAILYSLVALSITVLSGEGLGIAWGLMLFPLNFFSLKLLSQERRIRNILFLSVSLALLILASNIASILIIMLCLVIGYQHLRHKSFTFLAFSLFSIIYAFALSAFYILPAIIEGNLIHSVSLNNPLRFLPKSAVEKPQNMTDSPYQILTGDSEISNFNQGTNWFRFETNTKTHTIIRLSQIFFPDWKVFIDGHQTQVEYKNNNLGLMTIILGEGKHVVEGRLFDTPIRTISNIITVASAVSTLLLCLVQFKVVQTWLNYYRKRAH